MAKKTKPQLKAQSKNGDPWDQKNTTDWIDSLAGEDEVTTKFEALANDVADASTDATEALGKANATEKTVKELESKVTKNQGDINKLQEADKNNVKLTGDQVVSGKKTYKELITGTITSAIKLNTPRKINGVLFDGTADVNVKASNDDDLVHKSGDEDITGNKQFKGSVHLQKGVEVYGNQPYLDFHNKNDSSDFTTRFMETAPGYVSIFDRDNNSAQVQANLKGNVEGALVTRVINFTDFNTVANSMTVYKGNWSGRLDTIANSPFSASKWGCVVVIPYDTSNNSGIILLAETIRSSPTSYVGHVNQGGITWEKLNGNADTATKLQTSRTINGVPFDGTKNIELPNSEYRKEHYVELFSMPEVHEGGMFIFDTNTAMTPMFVEKNGVIYGQGDIVVKSDELNNGIKKSPILYCKYDSGKNLFKAKVAGKSFILSTNSGANVEVYFNSEGTLSIKENWLSGVDKLVKGDKVYLNTIQIAL